MDVKIPPIRTVTIPASDNHEGIYTVTLSLYWVCPACGQPRGDIVRVASFDGSQRMIVDGWRNLCGHVDPYSKVREEAKVNGLNRDLFSRQDEEWARFYAEAYPPAEATKALPLDTYAFVVGTLQQAALGANVRATATECLRLLGVGVEPDADEEDTAVLYPVQGE